MIYWLSNKLSQFIHPSVHQPINPFIHPFIHLSIHSSIHHSQIKRFKHDTAFKKLFEKLDKIVSKRQCMPMIFYPSTPPSFSIRLLLFLSLSLHLATSSFWSIYLSIHFFIYLSIHFFIYLSIHFFIYLSIHFFIYLPLCISFF